MKDDILINEEIDMSKPFTSYSHYSPAIDSYTECLDSECLHRRANEYFYFNEISVQKDGLNYYFYLLPYGGAIQYIEGKGFLHPRGKWKSNYGLYFLN